MSQTMAKNRVLTLLLALATALAMSLAIAPMAFAVDWNSSVKVTAVGGNTGSDAGGDKTESGQYISVEMKFTGSPNLSQIDNDTAESYLQENITIAGRHIDGTTAGYVRDVYDVVVDNSAKTITFKIAYNTAGTTANYNGRLLIAKNSTANSVIAEAMDADVETIIGTGVAIANNSGTNNADGSKTFEISSAAFNRGMVHVLIVDDYGALFTNTGTFSNGGLTVHAHEFASQIPADFAALICANANSLVTAENNTYETGLGYVFTDLGDGTFKVTDSDGDCSDVKVYIYDCNYLNTYALAVGAIYEPEIVNP